MTTKKWCQKQPKDSPYTLVHQELFINIAGPLSHAPQALFWLALYIKLAAGGIHKFCIEIDMDSLKEGGAIAFMSTLSMQALIMNAVMLKLNLIIPVHPFPGARVLVALLVSCRASLLTAGLLTAIAGIFMGIITFWIGLLLWIMN